MKALSLVTYFVTGGVFTTLIVVLEESGRRTLSGLATLVPVFTLVAYFFIGEAAGGAAVGRFLCSGPHVHRRRQPPEALSMTE